MENTDQIEDQDPSGYTELRVSGRTGSKELASAIASHIRQNKNVTLVTIGHQAIGQAVKAVPILNGYVAPKGYIYSIFPYFEDRTIDDGSEEGVGRTAMLMRLVKIEID